MNYFCRHSAYLTRTVLLSFIGSQLLTSLLLLATPIHAASPVLMLIGGNGQTSAVTTRLTNGLKVKAVDDNGNALSGVSITFSIGGYPAGASGMSVNPTTTASGADGTASTNVTLGTKAGTYTVQATANAGNASTSTFYLNAIAGPLNQMSLQPTTALLPPNALQQFSVSATDQYGNPIVNPIVNWRVTNNGGSINSAGLFTSNNNPGTYANTVVAASGSINASASVIIVTSSGTLPAGGSPPTTSGGSVGGGGDGSGGSGNGSGSGGSGGFGGNILNGKNVGLLDHVVITPNALAITAGAKTPVSAQAYDVFNNALATIAYSWTIEGPIGQLSSGYGPTAVFSAAGTPGNGSLSVEASQGDKKFSAKIPVAVANASGGKIVFSKIDSPQKTGTPFSVTITVKDFADNVIGGTGSPVVLTDTTGSVSPRVIKTLSAGTWTGEVTIDSGADDVVITATSGGFSGASNSFKVEGQTNIFKRGGGGAAGAAKALGLTDSNKVAFAIVSGLGLLGSMMALGLMASRGMQAIGRNPLARKQILLNLYLNAGIAIVGAFISLALALLLKKL